MFSSNTKQPLVLKKYAFPTSHRRQGAVLSLLQQNGLNKSSQPDRVCMHSFEQHCWLQSRYISVLIYRQRPHAAQVASLLAKIVKIDLGAEAEGTSAS